MLETMRVNYGVNFKRPSEIKSSTGEAGIVVPVQFGGKIIFTNPEQFWFWTEEWQAGEREVDEYIAAGNFKEFDSLDDLFSALDE